jgi:hypothetical protein
MEVGSAWTTANPKYKPGEPMLSEEDLKLAGPCCEALHAYVVQQKEKLTFLQRWMHPTFIVRVN